MEVFFPKPENPLEARAFVTTKRQLQEVFLPASSPPKRNRNNYATLYAVRHSRDIDFEDARSRSIATGKDSIFLDFVADDEPVIVGYFAKNEKDLHTYEGRVGEKQQSFFARSGVIVNFQKERRRI